MPAFHYKSGEAVREGDLVVVAGKRAVIERLFSERSAAAQDFACFETGGLMLKFEDGDVQVWPAVDEDLEFRGRASAHK
jgi:hypothetical protein